MEAGGPQRFLDFLELSEVVLVTAEDVLAVVNVAAVETVARIVVAHLPGFVMGRLWILALVSFQIVWFWVPQTLPQSLFLSWVCSVKKLSCCSLASLLVLPSLWTLILFSCQPNFP